MSHDDARAARPVGASTGAEERVAALSGDRLCTGCGYNLVGQMVVREPHYRLLIVRCPECGTVASLQEYPLLGRWASRWGAILAVLWFITLMGAWAGSSGAICGLTIGTAEVAADKYGRHLRTLHRAWQQEQLAEELAKTTADPGTAPAPGPAPGSAQTRTRIVATPNLPPGTRQRVGDDFETWWKKQEPDALFAGAGGWPGAVDWAALMIWVPAAIVTFSIGWFWSIALLQLRRRWVLVWSGFVLLLACVFVGIGIFDWIDQDSIRSWRAGRGAVGPPAAIATLAFSAIVLAIGVCLGRAVTRVLIRLLLPPRLRGPLAAVWTRDGLEPPKVH